MLVEASPSPADKPATEKALLGRQREIELLDRLLDDVRGGVSGALVIRGEPGVGKTALLDYLHERAPGRRVARATGVQSEMELSLSGLHQLCAPMLGQLDRLPAPQRDALRTAFGMSAGEPPNRFLLGLAVLGLLSDAAEESPLVCLVDDAQWLDRTSAQALSFVARRVLAESVALVFVVREPTDEQEFSGLPELVVEGLGDDDARALLESVTGYRLDERVGERIVAETRGNPLALVELPRGLTAAELAGGFGLPDTMPLDGRIEESFLQRIDRLPADTQLLLLVAAAEPAGDPALLRRAADVLGIGYQAAAPAKADGLLRIGSRVLFHHPLVRSALYRAAAEEDRRRVHGALAEATDAEVDGDHRAWHRAQAATGPDEELADELERSAGRAQASAGLSAGGTFLALAAEFTVDPARRAERALAAAQAKHEAGTPDAALALLALVEAGPLDDLQRVRVDLLRAQIAFALNRGSDAVPLLLRAAKQFEPLDVGLARATYLDAISAAIVVGPVARGDGGGVLDVAQAVRAAPQLPRGEGPADLLLDGLVSLLTDGPAPAAPILKRALCALRSERMSEEEGLRCLWLGSRAAMSMWEDEAWHALADRHVQLARDAGALAVLPMALRSRMNVHIHLGEFTAAASLIEEVDAITKVTGGHHHPGYAAKTLAAWKGGEAEAMELMAELPSWGDGALVATAQYATAFLCNGLGRYEDALAAAEQVSEQPEALGVANWALAELVEAAIRSGETERAADAFERLAESTRASGTDWALGVEARSRALLCEGEAAEDRYREAIDRLGNTRVRAALARAHLVYGEWLRRERRRLDARKQLRIAHGLFNQMGLEGYAERAARELLATGETARKRNVETLDELTTQEAQIAGLARDGLSNPEIGARLFISPRTVEYHLHKVFGKLGIRSRSQLDPVLAADSDNAVQAA
jgi:DNA-binding CsgD family transcriptional regulator